MNVLSQIFKNKKTLPLDVFINKALYNEEYGYYSTKNPLGAKGDFVTSPLISDLFGEMLGIWCIAFWEKLGKPKGINIVELGPGDGSLCKTLIKVFSKFKTFNNIFKINLLEKSAFLECLQRKKINSEKVKWIKHFKEIEKKPTIFIANEFFDSLPIKQFILKDKIWYERFIKYINKKKIVFFDKKTNFKNLDQIDLFEKQKIIEFPIEGIKFLKSISKIIKKNDGGLICFDYGYINTKILNSSLQSVKKHDYSNLLNNVGKSDITHHIDFGLFAKIIKKLNLQLEGITEQGIFLQKMGIIQRANLLTKNVSFKDKADLYYRLKRLIDKKQMGQIFKVLFFKKKGIKFNLGFE